MGDATRATFLMALSQGHSLPASELARRAHVTPSTASIQLAKLVEGGLLTVERNGRHRYYGLTDPNVATAIESLAVIAPRRPASSLKQARVGSELQAARTCYDHLAGALGVALLDALQRQRLLTAELEPTKRGVKRFFELGIHAQVQNELISADGPSGTMAFGLCRQASDFVTFLPKDGSPGTVIAGCEKGRVSSIPGPFSFRERSFLSRSRTAKFRRTESACT